MRKKYINSNKTDVNTIYYRDKKGKILASSSTYKTTSDKKLSKFSLILGLLSLFVVLSSMFLTGYVDSKYENSYVDEVKVIEYQKIVGYETTGTNFDGLTDDNYFDYFNSNNKFYFKNPNTIVNDFISTDYLAQSTVTFRIRIGASQRYRIYNGQPYNLTDRHIYLSVKTDNAYRKITQMYLVLFSYTGTSYSSDRYIIGAYDIVGDWISTTFPNLSINTDFDYFVFNTPPSLQSSNRLIVDTLGTPSNFIYDEDYMVKSILNQLFVMNPGNPTPIYETYFSYEYPTGYYDYDWNGKLGQLSKLRNVFNVGMIDFDKNLYYVNNYKYVRGLKNDGLQYDNYNVLYNDLNIQNLLPYCSVVLYESWDEKIGSGKRDNYYLWYVDLKELDDNATDTQRKLWNYIKDNYITQYTLDNYINYYALKQYESFYKFTQVLIFPISIINNLMYDFGVLVRFVVDW